MEDLVPILLIFLGSLGSSLITSNSRALYCGLEFVVWGIKRTLSLVYFWKSSSWVVSWPLLSLWE